MQNRDPEGANDARYQNVKGWRLLTGKCVQLNRGENVVALHWTRRDTYGKGHRESIILPVDENENLQMPPEATKQTSHVQGLATCRQSGSVSEMGGSGTSDIDGTEIATQNRRLKMGLEMQDVMRGCNGDVT